MYRVYLNKDASGEPIQNFLMPKKAHRVRAVSGENCRSSQITYPIVRLASDVNCYVKLASGEERASLSDMYIPANQPVTIHMDEVFDYLSVRPSGELHGFLSVTELG